MSFIDWLDRSLVILPPCIYFYGFRCVEPALFTVPYFWSLALISYGKVTIFINSGQIPLKHSLEVPIGEKENGKAFMRSFYLMRIMISIKSLMHNSVDFFIILFGLYTIISLPANQQRYEIHQNDF